LIIDWVSAKYPKDFKYELTTHGNPKPGTCDRADAVVTALAGLKKYKEAQQLDEYVIAQWPKSDFALWAQMDIAEFNADIDNDATAEVALNKLVTDFVDHPRLAEAVHHAAFHYQELKKYDQTQRLDEYVITNWPQSDFALWAQMDIAEFNADRGNETAAVAAVNKLIIDYSDHPLLNEALFHVAVHYQQTKMEDQAHQIYQYIADNFSKNYEQTMWSQAVLVWYHVRQNDQANADIEYAKLLEVYKDQKNLPKEVFQIADIYTEVGNTAKARALHNQVLNEWPESEYVLNAKAGLIKADIKDGRDTEAETAIDDLIEDYNDRSDLPTVVFQVGEQYWNQAWLANVQNRDKLVESGLALSFTNESQSYFIKAHGVWEKIIAELPDSSEKANAYYFAAQSYKRLGQKQKAMEYNRKVVQNWPNYENAWHAQYQIIEMNKLLASESDTPISEIDALTAVGYENLLEKFPNCPIADKAQKWLSRYDERINLQAKIETMSPLQAINFLKDQANQGGVQ